VDGHARPNGTSPPSGTLSAFLEDLAHAGGASPAAGTAAPSAGEIIGRYRIVREVGHGGFGTVVEAHDTVLDRPVALKFLTPARPLGAPDERVRAEADAIARLSHPAIVQIHDRGTSGHGPFLVLELLEGQALSRRIERGPLPPREAVRIALEVARGLAHAHVRGVVHRDLKPANVFLCADGHVKILDFGLAHLVNRSESVAGGTPGWMAPEQFRGAPGDERSDVWALGAMMSRMLAGGGAAPGRVAVPEAPDLEALVEAMLSSDPAGRPRDASRVVEALEPVARRLADAAPREAMRLDRAWRAVRSLARPRNAALLAIAMAVVALGPYGYRVARRRLSPPPPPGERVLVAVADFANATDDRDLESLSGLLITSLEQSRRVTALTRARMLEILRQLGHSGAEKVDEALGREVARQAGARALLVATIHRFEDLYTIDVKALDPSSATYLFSLEERGRGKSGIPGLIDRISDRTREQLSERTDEIRQARIEVGRATTQSVEAYSHYYRGQALEQRLQYSAAVREYEAALKLDPGFALAQLEIAYLAEWGAASEERARQALDALFAAIDGLPLKERFLAQAWKAHADGRQEEAHRIYARAVEEFPADKQVLYLAGDLRYHEGDFAGAVGPLARAFELDTTDGDPLVHLRDALIMLGRPDEALAQVRRGVAANPELARLLWETHLRLGDDAAALEVARRAAAGGDPDDVLAVAWVEVEQGDLGAADRTFRTFAGEAAAPDVRGQALHGLMETAARRGRMHEALDLALRADATPAIGPDFNPHTTLAAVHIALGTPGGLSRVAAQLDRLDRGPAPLLKVLPVVAEAAGEPALARRLERKLMRGGAPFLAALRGEPVSRPPAQLQPGTDALNYAALLLAARAGRDREVVDAARFTVRWWSGEDHWRVWAHPRAWLMEAHALLRLGDVAGARAALVRAARDLDRPDPDLPWLPELRRLQKIAGATQTHGARARERDYHP